MATNSLEYSFRWSVVGTEVEVYETDTEETTTQPTGEVRHKDILTKIKIAFYVIKISKLVHDFISENWHDFLR